MIICGIDEAGRGPVVGPMVLAGFCIEEKKLPLLKEMGAKDSKAIAPKRRKELSKVLKKTAHSYQIEVIEPKEIDNALGDAYLNLNWLEALYTAKIINKLKPDKVMLDLPSNNKHNYLSFIRKNLKVNTELDAEHKADVTYPVVSAASILAKVERDRRIREIEKKIGQEIGSGYPSDPRTMDFLGKNHNKYDEIFRKSWASYKRQKQAKLK
jgi:ribonuclease HII